MVKKECYGILDKVFPLMDHGLREVPPECFHCPERISCLKAALRTPDGLQMREEMVDRAATSGRIGRLKRWSQKKALQRLMKEGREK